MTSRWTKIVLAALQFHSVLCVQFIFTHQNTVINQPAVYQCTVDTDSVSITWTVNETSSTSSSITSLGIVTQGAATQNSTLTIPGEATLNGTIVTCIAAGLVNGEVYLNISSAVLYIQGPPAPPKITCSLDKTYYNTMQYDVKCSWTEPHTIAGVEISEYDVSITRREHVLLQQKLITNTEVTYVRGNYNVSVAAVIIRGDNDLIGKVNTIEVIDEDLDIVCNYSFTLKVRNLNGKWMADCSVNVNDIKFAIEPPIPSLMSVIVCDSSLTCEQHTIKETIEENSAKVVQVVVLPDNEERNISVSVHYNSGLNVNSNHHRLISTFDVQGVSITQNSSIGQVCFNCSYVDGGSAKGCFIQYTNLQLITELSGNLSTLRAEGIKCVTGIVTGDYSISVFDIESDGKMYSIRPAYQTTTGVENILIIPSSISSSFTSSSLHSGSIASTPIPADNGFSNVIVGLTTAGSILLIILLVVVVSLLFHIFKCAKSKNYKPVYPNHNSMDLEINYTETVPNSNGPKPTLSTANVNSFPYSDVHHGPQPIQHEEYFRLNRRNPALSLPHSNNDVYSKLHGTDTKQTKAVSTSSEYSTLHQNSSVSGYTTQPRRRVTSGSFVVSLVAPIPHKWEEFGAALAITPTKLKEIRENHPNDDHRAFCDVILEWQTSRIRPFTLEILKMVLDRIGEGNRLVEHAEL